MALIPVDFYVSQPIATCSGYATEALAGQAFDDAIKKRDLFRPYSEVKGVSLCSRKRAPGRNVRIDRILFPTDELIMNGWQLGPVGVEIKASDKSIGEPVSQIIDYLFCKFSVPQEDFDDQLDMIFLFPCPHVNGPLESIFHQQMIGNCQIDHNGDPAFKCGKSNILIGEMAYPIPYGLKYGSR